MQGKEAAIVQTLTKLFPGELKQAPNMPYVWTISLNRRATPALSRSVPAVKADAARTLFTVNCSEIVWAVIDSGVDATHYAFRSATKDENTRTVASRVKRSFDFTSIRDIVTLDNLDAERRTKRLRELLKKKLRKVPSETDGHRYLRELAKGASEGRSTPWQLVEPFVELDPYDQRQSSEDQPRHPRRWYSRREP